MRSSFLDVAGSSAGVALSRYIPLAFVPAGVGLLVEIVTATTTADRVLLLALFVFCPELAHMAQLDLKNLLAVVAQDMSPSLDVVPAIVEPPCEGQQGLLKNAEIVLDPAETALAEANRTYLLRFYLAVVSTVVLELIGFYTALFSLSWGAVTILFSQVCFNLLATVQLLPDETPAIVPFGIADRATVLIANAIGIVLLLFWFVDSLQLSVALSLLGLITLFMLLKYGALWASVLFSK